MTDDEHREWEEAYREAFERELMRAAYEDDEPDYDGDECPNCGRMSTRRIDIIAQDPTVWVCECAVCGEHFEVLGGGYQ